MLVASQCSFFGNAWSFQLSIDSNHILIIQFGGATRAYLQHQKNPACNHSMAIYGRYQIFVEEIIVRHSSLSPFVIQTAIPSIRSHSM